MQKLLILLLIFLSVACHLDNNKVPIGQKGKETVHQIQPSKTKIEGVYEVVNEPNEVEKCAITITIEKVGPQYIYKFKSDSRSLEGKVSLKVNEEKDGFYITFEGIQWSEYEGELVMGEDGDYYPKEDLENPVGINGLIKENQIMIQNYGNSMNYYVQLSDCGKKYIFLKKRVTTTQESESIAETSLNEIKDNDEPVDQDECFDESAFGLPYNHKNVPSESGYKVVKCDLKGTEEFLCDNPMLRYIPLPDYNQVKVVLVPMDCGDFDYRLFLLTFVNKRLVANQYVEGELSEPGTEQYKEFTGFTIDKRYVISITTKSYEDGKTAVTKKKEFQLMQDGKLKEM
jgi:hypothetical protein